MKRRHLPPVLVLLTLSLLAAEYQRRRRRGASAGIGRPPPAAAVGEGEEREREEDEDRGEVATRRGGAALRGGAEQMHSRREGMNFASPLSSNAICLPRLRDLFDGMPS